MAKDFKFDTTPERSNLMKKIRAYNTKPEIKFRKRIWEIGFRYRINSKNLPGKPDIVITKHKVVIFIDGEFWHGYQWDVKKNKIRSNREYWIPKIEKTIKRDISNNKRLRDLGFIVLRFWEHQINKDFENCIKVVLHSIKNI
jgi:DNA mismatch endonuclease, patch repair protein